MTSRERPLARLQLRMILDPLPMRPGAWGLAIAAALAACATGERPGEPAVVTAAAQGGAAVGLAIEIDDGVGVPVSVIKGQTFYLNQVDIRATAVSTTDEGVDGLAKAGDFAGLQWGGTRLVDESFVGIGNPDGTFTRRRFFRGATWMRTRSTLTIQPRDADGGPLGPPLSFDAGHELKRSPGDDFFTRRLRAIQWAQDCPTSSSCAGATVFLEEGLVELRYAAHPERTFVLHPQTQHLAVTWSANPRRTYEIPVTQVDQAPYAYGFSIDLDAITPPRSDGSYAPGSAVTFRITLRDGAGNRLHPEGSLPSYAEVVFGPNPAGIQYYRAFFDPSTTYYRRKHRERMLMSDIIGPAQNVQPIRSVTELEDFLFGGDVQTTATLERDGVYAQARTFPMASDLFGGAFFPGHGGWFAPVSDTWSYTLPEDAPAGTYLVAIKGRRVYLGEDVPFSRTLEIQVGSPERTHATLDTGPCTSCHTGPSQLGQVLHGTDDRRICASCHVPLAFELEGPIAVRTHFIHSRSAGRLDVPLSNCSACHLTAASIQRTSKAACLSCHTSYPGSHVQAFGPITDMYIGGGRESFDACTSSCHTAHPGSGL
jgi:hypothetical protein